MASNNNIFKMSNAGGFKTLNRYPDMLAGNATWVDWAPSNSYDSIATVTLGSSASTITFSSIPSTYRHLQIRAFVKSSYGSTDSLYAYPIMGDTTAANYSDHHLYGDGATATATGNANSALLATLCTPNSSATNIGGIAIIDILDYANTNKGKTIRTLAGFDTNNTQSGVVSLNSFRWGNTTAISSFTLNGNGNFAQYSSFALYGIR